MYHFLHMFAGDRRWQRYINQNDSTTLHTVRRGVQFDKPPPKRTPKNSTKLNLHLWIKRWGNFGSLFWKNYL